MHTLHDYVNWIAKSMGVELSDEQLDGVTTYLIRNEKYADMLHDLEDMIRQVGSG